jgi:hypothetical protein
MTPTDRASINAENAWRGRVADNRADLAVTTPFDPGLDEESGRANVFAAQTSNSGELAGVPAELA